MEQIKIVKGNDFLLKINVSRKLLDGTTEAAMNLEDVDNLSVRLVAHSHYYELPHFLGTAQGVVYARCVNIPVGTYALQVSGVYNKNAVCSYELKIISIVLNNAKGNVTAQMYNGEPSYQIDTALKLYTGVALEIADEVEEGNTNAVTSGAVYDYVEVNDASLGDLEDRVSDLESGKVDKVDGKGLSTNDFTNSEKNKLAFLKLNLSYDKASHLILPDDQATMMLSADTVPTKNSNNLILSKAVYDAIDKVGGYILTVTQSSGGYTVTSNKPLPTNADEPVNFFCKFSEVIFPLSHAFTGSWYFAGVHIHYGSSNLHKMIIKVQGGSISSAVVEDIDIEVSINELKQKKLIDFDDTNVDVGESNIEIDVDYGTWAIPAATSQKAGLLLPAEKTKISNMIPEAPNDGKLYGRKNGQWVEIAVSPQTKPTYQDLIDGLVVMAGSNGTEEFTLKRITNSNLCLVNTGDSHCLGEIEFNSSMLNTEVETLELGNYLGAAGHNVASQAEGTLVSVKYNGNDVTVNKTLPLYYDYHEEDTALHLTLTF